METFHYKYKSFENRLILKTVSLILLNILIFIWSLLNIDPSKRNFFLCFGILFLACIFYFLYQNFQKQKKLIHSSKLNLKVNILQQMFHDGECNQIDLKNISKIEKDIYRGFLRYQIYQNENILQVINIEDSVNFEKRLIEISKKEIIEFHFNKKEIFLKVVILFIPALICYLLFKFQYLDQRIVYLVLTVNFFYFMIQFSEKRFRGGFSESSVRRTIFVLIVLIFYQFLGFI
jgi:hypothetical protein